MPLRNHIISDIREALYWVSRILFAQMSLNVLFLLWYL